MDEKRRELEAVVLGTARAYAMECPRGVGFEQLVAAVRALDDHDRAQRPALPTGLTKRMFPFTDNTEYHCCVCGEGGAEIYRKTHHNVPLDQRMVCDICYAKLPPGEPPVVTRPQIKPGELFRHVNSTDAWLCVAVDKRNEKTLGVYLNRHSATPYWFETNDRYYRLDPALDLTAEQRARFEEVQRG
jgi:hypothetical protein